MAAYLSEVSAVKGHAMGPEVFEEVREDFFLDVLRLNTISHTALLYYLCMREGEGREEGWREGGGESWEVRE